jgi:hypothetical protein
MIAEDRSRIVSFVRSYRKRLIAERVARAWAISVVALFLLLAVLQAAFALFPWIVLPVIFDVACVCAALFAAGFLIVAVTVKAPRLVKAAGIIERQSELKNPLLSIALELSQDSRTTGNPFTDQTCRRVAGQLRDYPAAPAGSHRVIPLALAALVLALWCAINPFFSPRLLDYWSLPFAGVSRGEIAVTPGSVTVPLNAPVNVRLACMRTRFPSCLLTIAEIGGGRTSGIFLRPDARGTFNFRIDSAKHTFSYRFEPAGGGTLVADTVTVRPPPRLEGLSVALTPPVYTHQADRSLPEGQGDFEAYAGTMARIAIKSGPQLKGAWCIRCGDTVPLVVRGERASGTIDVLSSGGYTFSLLDSLGQRSDSLPSFHIECIPDQPPSVQILKPGCSRDLTPTQLETLMVEGVDDIGIRSMAVRWRLSGQRADETGIRSLVAGNDAPVIRSSFIWHVAELSLYPGDSVYYWAQATDTRPRGGGQTASSDTFTFRIPTIEEISKALVEGEDRTEKALDGAMAHERSLSEKLDKALKSSRGQKELTWEQRQVLQDAQQEAGGQADSLRQSLASLRENVERMKQEGTAGAELAEKFDQVRAAMEELLKQYGDSLLYNMNDFNKPVSMQDIRAAIEKTQASLPKLGEQLDNALKFLKMLKEDRKLSELAMRAEALSREQKTLSRSDAFGPSEMARQKELLDEMRKLSDEAGDQAKEHAGGADSLPSKRGIDSLGGAMRSSVDRQQAPSHESMNRMSGSLLSLSEDLMRMMNFGEQQRLERDRNRLLALAQKALSMADWQQELAQAPETSRDAASAALSQQALDDALKQSRAASESLSMAPPDRMLAISTGFRNAESAMQAALNAMGARARGRGGNGEGASGPVTALQSLANTLLATVSQMDKGEQSGGGGEGGMMPGLRRLSGRQAAINSVTSELLRSMLSGNGAPQEGGSGGQGLAQARRAAQSAQQAIADDLKRLADKYGAQSGEGMADKATELEKEARHLTEMLEHPSQELADRQDRFLSRMLETALSMHRQGEGRDEFKAQSAATPYQEGPVVSSGTLFRERDAFSRLRLRAFQGNYPENYREALQKYFDILSERYLK